VDTEAGVIRGVSVLTSGLVARGHDLAVDGVTLKQLIAAAEAKGGQVPVKVDHKSGAAAVCGYLDNFHLDGGKAKADWHLLATHPQRDQILEVAQRMPTGVGLSASFIAPPDAERGKARVQELISVDYVTLPAANPDGLFSARTRRDPEAVRRERIAKVGRVLGAGAVGAVGGAGLAASGLEHWKASGLRRLQPSAKVRAGLIGAGAALGGASALRAAATSKRDERDFAAKVHQLASAIREVKAEAKTEADNSARIHPHRRPLGKRIAIRAAKIGVGAAGGAYIGRKLGTAAGATTGALAGVLFQSKAARDASRAGIRFAAKLTASKL
jgi:hypothetical protein